MHTPNRQCTSDCRKVGCPTEDVCAYCGENKWENTEKHIGEIAKFCREQIEEIQKVFSPTPEKIKTNK